MLLIHKKYCSNIVNTQDNFVVYLKCYLYFILLCCYFTSNPIHNFWHYFLWNIYFRTTTGNIHSKLFSILKILSENLFLFGIIESFHSHFLLVLLSREKGGFGMMLGTGCPTKHDSWWMVLNIFFHMLYKILKTFLSLFC